MGKVGWYNITMEHLTAFHPELFTSAIRTRPINFTEFRRDGWPLCPFCGADELVSKLLLHRPPLALTDCLAGEFTCYACHWDSQRNGDRVCQLPM